MVHLGVWRSQLCSLADTQMSIPVPARAAALPWAVSARSLCKPQLSKPDEGEIQPVGP